MHVRVCIMSDGSASYAVVGSDGDYYKADPEWIGACFAGIEGTDPITKVEVAGVKWETQPVATFDSGGN